MMLYDGVVEALAYGSESELLKSVTLEALNFLKDSVKVDDPIH
jgi:hypothetical protein